MMNIHAGTIIVRCGARYNNYASNLGRTYFINANSNRRCI